MQSESQTLASITYQNYFKLYKKISGCTGTALTEAEEFLEIYNLPVVSIPTNKKMIRKDHNDKIFRSQKEKDVAILNKINEINKTGQPILVFTSSINKSEHYSSLLSERNIKHIVLNAKNHEREADIIANAGKKFSVIITTSISGRGVDIKLGGKNDKNNENEEIKKIGGLFVLGTERMESRRVDNQARGRSGRQGDSGGSIFYVSLDDDLMRIFGSDSLNKMLEKLGLKDGESIDHPWINKALERAQQKVEARNFDIRKTLLKFDNVLNDQRQVIFRQRYNLIESDKGVGISQDFLDDIIKELIELKQVNLSNPKNIKIISKFRSSFGNAYNEEEILDLIKMENERFEEVIKKKFDNIKQENIKIIGDEQFKLLEKRIFLQILDQGWKNHIQYLEQLRQVIGLRSYGNRDPLIEYKKEAFYLFEELLYKIKSDLIKILINIKVLPSSQNKKNNEVNQSKINPQLLKKKIGRNDPCFCGSGKKYKHCCGSL